MNALTKLFGTAAAVGVGMMLAIPSPALAAGENTSAYALSVDVSLPVVGSISTQTPLATLANPNTSLANVAIAPVASASLLSASASSTATSSTVEYQSGARVEDLQVNLGLVSLSAPLVTADCASTSTPGDTPSGDSSVTNLQVGGVLPVSVPVNPAPNTTIGLSTILGPVAILTLNEQIVDPVANTLTVNALHLEALPGSPLASGDVIAASATCDTALAAEDVPLVSVSVASGVGMVALAGYVTYRLTRRRGAGESQIA